MGHAPVFDCVTVARTESRDSWTKSVDSFSTLSTSVDPSVHSSFSLSASVDTPTRLRGRRRWRGRRRSRL
eukprot:827218-Rhodomonas_salina.1